MEEPGQPRRRRIVDVIAAPQPVADFGRIRIGTNVAAQRHITQLLERLDFHDYAKQMPDPTPRCVAERGKAFAPGGQIDRHVKTIAALSVAGGVITVDHVDIGFGENA